MRFTVDRTLLMKALARATSVVERRNTIPILGNVALSAADDTVSLRATDLDIEVQETVRAAVAQAGGTTVAAHVLHDIVRKLPDGAEIELRLDTAAGRVNLTAGNARFALPALPIEDFPQLALGETPHRFELDGDILASLLEKTRFAISTEETRYYLNGVYLHTLDTPAGRRLRAVATDGHRLARMEVPQPDGAGDMPGVIVPRKTVAEALKMAGEASGPIAIALSPTKIQFSGAATVLTSKLIDGTFPDYARVIPTGNAKRLEVTNADFVRAVDLVSTMSSEKGRAVKLHIGDGKLTLSVNNPEWGSGTQEVPVAYTDEPMEIGFNARYLLDIAGQIDGESAIMALSDASSPTIVSEGDASAALYVLMPMRV